MERFDLIVLGAGAAGMTAAAVAATRGLRVLLLEHTQQVGGTTAISGGMVWIPANHKMAQAGVPDSLAQARTYLEHATGMALSAGMETFLARGDEAIRYLEKHTTVRLQPVVPYPDYDPRQPGATPGGRVLEPLPFDARVLGKHFSELRPPLPEFTLFGGMMISRADIPHLRKVARSWRSAWHVGKLLLRHARERLRAPRGTTLYLGNALAARLYKSVLDLGVTVRTGCTPLALVREGAQVMGVDVERMGQRVQLQARHGVVLACGGLSQDAALRARYVPPLAGVLTATMAAGAPQAGAVLAMQVGAQLSAPGSCHQAFWVPASTFQRSDGSTAVFPHTVTDRGKPGLIAVDQHGRRFVNEARSYHEFVKGQLKAGTQAVPAYLVCDRPFLWRYGLGGVKPFTWSLRDVQSNGYLHSAPTLEALADQLGLPRADFLATVARYNADARHGVDREFGRGEDIYQRHLGDAQQQPNPCVAPIEQAPFYAMAVKPADLGMAAGIVTDPQARVLDDHGQVIPGLYACGNDMQSVMNGAYPGPGITLGPALVFGYIAATQACEAPLTPA